jgi:hypothetical protein
VPRLTRPARKDSVVNISSFSKSLAFAVRRNFPWNRRPGCPQLLSGKRRMKNRKGGTKFLGRAVEGSDNTDGVRLPIKNKVNQYLAPIAPVNSLIVPERMPRAGSEGIDEPGSVRQAVGSLLSRKMPVLGAMSEQDWRSCFNRSTRQLLALVTQLLTHPLLRG